METECWTVQARDRDGILLAETRLVWEPGQGIAAAETERYQPSGEWEHLRKALQSILAELPE